MLNLAEYAKFFLALLVIIDPIGAIPLFATLTAGSSAADKKRTARIAGIAVAAVLVVSAVAGERVLELFGISMASFKVGGAILILLLAISMINARQPREKQTPEEAREAEDKENIAVVPLAIPLLAGPGAISTTVIYATERGTAAHLGIITALCLAVAFVTWLALRVAAPVGRWLGKTGINIAIRVMGLLLAAVAVEIFASGIVVLLPGLGPASAR